MQLSGIEYRYGTELQICYVAFPEEANDFYGVTVKGKRCKYAIFINASRSKREQAKSLCHEIAHIMLGHIEDYTHTVMEKEHEAVLYAALHPDLKPEDAFPGIKNRRSGPFPWHIGRKRHKDLRHD